MDGTRRHVLGLAAGLVGAGTTCRAFAADAPLLSDHPMVARIWHGRTSAAKAEAYKAYLYEAGVKKIASLPGNRGVQMMMAKTADEGAFTVVSFWDSIEAIKGYAGADYTKVHDLPRDSEFLIDHEPLVHHYDLDVNFWQS